MRIPCVCCWCCLSGAAAHGQQSCGVLSAEPRPLLPRAGISLKTQILYVIVFCTRYMDLFWNFASLYNWCMKVRDRPGPLADRGVLTNRNCALQLLFITSSVGIVFIMLRGHQHGRLVVAYDPATDCKVTWRSHPNISPSTARGLPANSLLSPVAPLSHAPVDCSGQSTG